MVTCRPRPRRSGGQGERGLGAGPLGLVADDAVVLVDPHDIGLVDPGLGVVELDEGGDDAQVARLVEVGGRTVGADDARPGLSPQGVGDQAAAPRDVPDMDRLVLNAE